MSTYHGTIMTFEQLEERTGLWIRISFTQVICVQHGIGYELYAEEASRHTKSRLFLCVIKGTDEAHKMTHQLNEWLNIINTRRKYSNLTEKRRAHLSEQVAY